MSRKKSAGRPPIMIPLTIHLTRLQRRKLQQLTAASDRSMTAVIRKLIENAP